MKYSISDDEYLSNSDNTDKNNLSYLDIAIHLENQIRLFDEMVDILWENVILKYIRDGKLFQNLLECDKDKFYKYMMDNCKIINFLYDKLNYYNNLSKKCT